MTISAPVTFAKLRTEMAAQSYGNAHGITPPLKLSQIRDPLAYYQSVNPLVFNAVWYVGPSTGWSLSQFAGKAFLAV